MYVVFHDRKILAKADTYERARQWARKWARKHAAWPVMALLSGNPALSDYDLWIARV